MNRRFFQVPGTWLWLWLGVLFGALSGAPAAGEAPARDSGPTTPPTALRAAQRLLEVGRPVVALDSARVALSQLEAAGAPDTLLLAEAATAYANAALRSGFGADPESERRARQAVALLEARPGAPLRLRTRARGVLANVTMANGGLSEAGALRRRNLDEWLAAPDSLQWRAGNDLDALAQLAGRRGEYAEASRLFEQSLAAYESAPHPDPVERLMTLSNATGPLLNLRRVPEARRMAQAAARLADSLRAATGQYFPLVYINAAECQAAGGDDSAALADYERLRLELEKESGIEPRLRAMVAGGAAEHALVLGHAGLARERIRDALSVWNTPALRHSLAYGYDRATEALILAASGDSAAACAADSAALALFDDLGAGLTRPAVGCAGHFARIAAGKGDLPGAVRVALDAERRRRSQLRLVTRGLSEPEALRYATLGIPALDVAVAAVLLPSSPDSLRAAVFDALVRSRGVVLDELATRRSLAGSADSLVQQAWRAAQAVRERLAYLTVSAPRPAGGGQRAELLARTRMELEQRERALALASQPYAALRTGEGLGGSEVRRALPEAAALLSFRTVALTTGAVHYVAWINRGDSSCPALIDLGERGNLDALIESWRREMSVRPGAPADAAACRRAGVRLRKALWDPLRSAIGRSDPVFVVPDEALYLVSFAALPTGKDGYLVESGPIFHYLDTERDLVLQNLPDAPSSPRSLLACGGPIFSELPRVVPSRRATHRGGPPCQDLASLHFDPLPLANAEIEEIAAFWQGEARRGPARVVSGADASEAEFTRQAHGCEVIHLATNGFFVEPECDRPLRTATRFDVPEELPAEGVTSPLALSGIALAGANRRAEAASGATDGILVADEIAGLDLRGTDLVILSACDTGRGVTIGGEGILGLRRAFRVAGAGSVLMSLWSVPDATMRRWSLEFYRARYGQGADVPHAVRAADRAMLALRRTLGPSTHPMLWAGLIAAGAWR